MTELKEFRGGIEQEQSLDRLRNFKNIDLSHSFKLEDEKDEKGELVKGDVYWIAIKDGENVIEGKFYCPADSEARGANELVIFEPGMPGDGVILFDKRHAPNLVKDGYYVFSARHNGTIVNSEKSGRYVNCPKKQEWGKEHGQEFMGKPFGFKEWGKEVFTAIRGMAGDFDRIHLVGHSAGSLNILNSLAFIINEAPELAEKIESFISLSGLIGRLRPDGALDPDGVNNLNRVRGFLEYIKNNKIHESVDPEENLGQLQDSLKRIYGADFKALRNARFLFTAPDKVLIGHSIDEYCPFSSSKEFVEHLSSSIEPERIKLLKFGTYYDTIAKKGFEAHDFPYLRTSFLLRWISKGK